MGQPPPGEGQLPLVPGVRDTGDHLTAVRLLGGLPHTPAPHERSHGHSLSPFSILRPPCQSGWHPSGPAWLQRGLQSWTWPPSWTWREPVWPMGVVAGAAGRAGAEGQGHAVQLAPRMTRCPGSSAALQRRRRTPSNDMCCDEVPEGLLEGPNAHSLTEPAASPGGVRTHCLCLPENSLTSCLALAGEDRSGGRPVHSDQVSGSKTHNALPWTLQLEAGGHCLAPKVRATWVPGALPGQPEDQRLCPQGETALRPENSGNAPCQVDT